MKQPPTLESYWSIYLRTLPEQNQDKSYYEAFSFGTTPQSAGSHLELVLQGKKTGSANWA